MLKMKQILFLILIGGVVTQYGYGMEPKEEQKQLIKQLFNACKNENPSLEEIKELIKSGVDVNAGDSYKETPLHYACQNKNINIDVIKLLIESGADVNAGDYLDSKDKGHNTPLHYACKNKNLDIEVIKLLIKHKVNVNTKTWNDN